MNNHSRDAKKGKATTTQQKGKATQHTSPKTVIFQKKIGCLGWDSNPQPSAFQAMLLPTEIPRQLSWLGSNPGHVHDGACKKACVSRRIHSENRTITLARKQHFGSYDISSYIAINVYILFLKAENDPLQSEFRTPLDFNSYVRMII